MSVLLTLALLPLGLLSPQGTPAATGQDPAAAGAKPALLTAPEQEALRTKLIKYLDAEASWDQASGLKNRERASKAREKAKDDFEKEWGKLEKKGDLLGSMVDMHAVFQNCFVVDKPSFSLGQLRAEKLKEEGIEYSFWVPKVYVADKPHRTVIALPGTGSGGWTKPADWFAATWDKTNLVNSTIVQVCQIPSGLELDPVPDFTREGAEAEEDRRNKTVLVAFGHLMGSCNVERSAVFLDCGRGACGYGLRFLSMFPDRFAGIVLRDPVAVDDIRLGSLHGKAVLMLKTAANGEVVGALQKRLEALTPNSVTVIDATDDYPHKAAAADIETWMGKQKRDMTPTKVIIEPNHDRFKRSYWVHIDRADPLAGLPVDMRPRLEVEADRTSNRIVVKARGVESFVLYLNDDIVDLGKEFTVVVNDKAVAEKRVRSFRDMRERMVTRRDWEYLFPVMYASQVPKAADPEPAKKDGETKESGPK